MTSGRAALEDSAADALDSVGDVARYYDRNTGRFLLMGRGRIRGLHRQLWTPGASTSEEAAGHIDELLAAELIDVADQPNALVVDFGCGVGGTLFRLAERLPAVRLRAVAPAARRPRPAGG